MVQRALEKHNVAQPWAQDYQLFQALPGDRGEQGQLGARAGGQLQEGGGRLTGMVLAQSRGEMKQGWGKGRKTLVPSLDGVMRLSCLSVREAGTKGDFLGFMGK